MPGAYGQVLESPVVVTWAGAGLICASSAWTWHDGSCGSLYTSNVDDTEVSEGAESVVRTVSL